MSWAFFLAHPLLICSSNILIIVSVALRFSFCRSSLLFSRSSALRSCARSATESGMVSPLDCDWRM